MTTSTTTPSHNISAADLEKMVTDIVARALAAQGERFASKADSTRVESKVEAEASRLESKADADSARLQGKIDRLEGETKASNAGLDGKIDRLRGEMKGEFSRLEGKMDVRFASVEGEIKEMKSEIRTIKLIAIGSFLLLLGLFVERILGG